MNKAERASAKIQRLATAVGCTQQGINWMETSLDPFPDDNRVVDGYPDIMTGKSVVQFFRQKVTVTDGGLGVPFDCLISHDGMHGACPVYTNTSGANNNWNVASQGATPYNLGGITVRRAAANTNLYVTTAINALQMVPSFSTTMPFRIVAMGIEIANTTPELYKGGNIIVWRQTRKKYYPVVTNLAAAANTAPFSAAQYLPVATIPETASDALLCQGSRSWAAEKGAYLVGTLCNPTMDPEDTTSNYQTGTLYTSNGANYQTLITTTATTNAFILNPSQTYFNQFGAYLTGLPFQSTLDVTLHYVVERFPRAVDVDLITMSSPSPPYDPKILELYSKTAWHLPVGVPFDENGLGDWLCDVADILGNFGIPGMGIAKGIVKGIQGISNSFDKGGVATGGTTTTIVTPDKGTPTAVVRKEIKKEVKKEMKNKQGAKQGPRLPNGNMKSDEAKRKKQKAKAKKRAQG